MLLDRSSRGDMARCCSKGDSTQEGRALREVCRLLMNRLFRGTTKCRSEYGWLPSSSEAAFSRQLGFTREDYATMAFLRCDVGVRMEKVV